MPPALPDPAPPPIFPRMSQGEFNDMMGDFMRAQTNQRRSTRLSMYKKWLGT